MVDADGTIYQTLDLVERAFHAEEANATSIGVEICNRGKVDRSEWPKLPAEYRTRPTREVVINGEHHEAYDFRPEQYDSLVALARALLRVFPKIKPQIPEQNGQVIMDTLADPMSFAGILGHLHVDLQRQKWDPGALDWHRLMRALNGFELPVQIRSFTDLPRTQQDLVSARRAAFYNAEERATGFFPVAAGRLWHSGVHIRAALGSGVHAPTRGRIIAARNATAGASSRSFVLIRHDLDVDDEPVTFYSLIAHIALPSLGSYEANTIPWLQSVAHGPVAIRAALEAGEVVNIDERVEAGDVIGHVGTVSRGPEQGPEIHFEIFTTERLGGDFGRAFHYINAAGDGPITRRADLIAMADRSGDQELYRRRAAPVLSLRRPRQATGAAPRGDPPPPRVGRPHHRSRLRRPARARRHPRSPAPAPVRHRHLALHLLDRRAVARHRPARQPDDLFLQRAHVPAGAGIARRARRAAQGARPLRR